ncbi:MAG: protocatechuate 3,4-dioxygenase subunit beta [Myxococcales bacterium]|nr:protocatechuate 3,4-dioxygenase subunit beta [Myxococcales bacterium]
MSQPRDWTVDPSRHPPLDTPGYGSTRLRAPRQAPILLSPTRSETTSPVFGQGLVGPTDHDLLVNFGQGDPIGERIVVHGRVLDSDGRPVPDTLVEMWQANAAGRYRHPKDGYRAPLDPNFGGCGRTLTGSDGRFAFRTVKPGAYPWPNGGNDWRPAHIHFSVFGTAFAQRLITQMYFEGDPLISRCAIVNGLPPDAVAGLVGTLDMERTIPMDLIAWRFDIVVAGRSRTPFEEGPR